MQNNIIEHLEEERVPVKTAEEIVMDIQKNCAELMKIFSEMDKKLSEVLGDE